MMVKGEAALYDIHMLSLTKIIASYDCRNQSERRFEIASLLIIIIIIIDLNEISRLASSP